MLYNTILIPSDGSLASEEVIRFICSIQKSIQGKVYVVYVIEVPRSLPLNECPPDLLQTARQTLERAEKIARDYEAEIEAQIIYARTAEDSILSTAETLNCDIIAIAQSNQKLKLFANTALNIYQRAKCSVWLLNIK